MKIKSVKLLPFFALLLLSTFMFSCVKENLTEDKSENPLLNGKSFDQPKVVTSDLPGRNLASNCFQCHGTNGYAGELKIAGESASGIISELEEMKAKDPRENIMNVHARAYTTEEIKLIGDYFSKQ
jgi:sulfide dehydrogenase cytochrome subunit